jgi:predicted membrane-bound spermidine synthase
LKKSLLASFIFFGLTGYWFHQLSAHFFEFRTPNQMAFWVFILLPLMALRFAPLAPFKNNFFTFFSSLCLISMILGSYPLTQYLIGITDHGWVWVNIMAITIVFMGTQLKMKWLLLPMLTAILVWMIPFAFIPNQKNYAENVISSTKTRKGIIDQVRWDDDQWTYYNGRLSTATPDQSMYGEATLYPLLQLLPEKADILIIGGDNGVVAQQLMKSQYSYQSLHIVPYDIGFLQHQLTDLNHEQWTLIDQNISSFVESTTLQFDAIIIDLFDPASSLEVQAFMQPYFTKKLLSKLDVTGFLLTQMGDVYKQPTLFKTYTDQMMVLNFGTVPYHLQIPTIGQMGWVLVSKEYSSIQLATILTDVHKPFPSQWWNEETMAMMISMGKQDYFMEKERSTNRK